MTDLENLNRAVNRALRELNAVAVGVASAPLGDRKGALAQITQALAHVDALQRSIYTADPSLEYHYDPNRPPTESMNKVADLVDAAEAQVAKGDVRGALETLHHALQLEPPPLAYETIEKRLKSLQGGKTAR